MASLPSSQAIKVERARRALLGFTAYTKPDYYVNWHHAALCKALDGFVAGDIKRLMVFMPPRHGKCLAAGTLVTMGDGTVKKIEDICRLDTVISVDLWYNVTSKAVASIHSNGEKPVLKITLLSGRQLECTENHSLLTVHGWREAGTLVVGDRIAALRKTPMPEGVPLPFGFAALMGYITGDGSFSKGNPIITTIDPATVAHLEEISAAHGWALRKDGDCAYHVRKATGHSGWGNGTSAQERLRGYIPPAKSAQKRVPECIFQAGPEDLAAFLAAYFNCDGTVTGYRSGVAEYYSVSRELLQDTQLLLTRFGVYSQLRPKKGRYQGGIHHSWRLIIEGQDLVKFAEVIPVRGEKGEKLRALAEQAKARRHFPEYESIPDGWKKFSTKGIGWHRGHSGIRADKRYKRGTARHIVQAIAEIEENDELLKLCNPSIIWERIVSIETSDDAPTYDLEVDETHNFIANGVVVHNSELVSRRLPAYILGKRPDAQIIACSYSADLAQRMNRDTQRIIDDTRYRELFPGTQLFGANVRTVAQGTYLRNSDIFEVVGHRGTYRSAGVGGGITGMGFDYGIIDDPVKNRAEAESKTYRDALWEWYTSTFYTRAEKDATILVTCTRWHQDDLAGRLLEYAQSEDGDKWTVIDFPAIKEVDGNPDDTRAEGDPLWPEKYSADRLAKIRGVLGSYQWSALYQQRPTPAEGGMFKRHWFDIVEALPADGRWARWWDRAATSKGGDYSAGVLMFTSGGMYYVVDVQRGQWSSEQRNVIIRQTAALDAGRSGGECVTWSEQEPGSSGLEVAEAFVRLLAGYAVSYEPSTGSKEVRAMPFAAQCEAGNVKLLRGPWNAAYLDEITSFPFGTNDDQVDASSGAFGKLANAPWLMF